LVAIIEPIGWFGAKPAEDIRKRRKGQKTLFIGILQKIVDLDRGDYYNVSDFVPIVFQKPLRGRKQ
jgi:hypothetical protein